MLAAAGCNKKTNLWVASSERAKIRQVRNWRCDRIWASIMGFVSSLTEMKRSCWGGKCCFDLKTNSRKYKILNMRKKKKKKKTHEKKHYFFDNKDSWPPPPPVSPGAYLETCGERVPGSNGREEEEGRSELQSSRFLRVSSEGCTEHPFAELQNQRSRLALNEYIDIIPDSFATKNPQEDWHSMWTNGTQKKNSAMGCDNESESILIQAHRNNRGHEVVLSFVAERLQLLWTWFRKSTKPRIVVNWVSFWFYKTEII